MSKVDFITVEEFMTAVNESKVEVIENPNTNKLFLSGEKSKWKVEQKLNFEQEVKMLIPQDEAGDPVYEQACLVNVKASDNAKMTFTN